MKLDNYIHSKNASLRLKKKNILFYFDEGVASDTHHISALFFDMKRFLKQDEYKSVLKKLSETHLNIIDFVATNVDELPPKELLSLLGEYESEDLIFVHDTLDYIFDSSVFYTVECLFELAILFKELK